MEQINIKVDSEECLPKKAHVTDAGYDLIAKRAIKIFDEYGAECNINEYSNKDYITIPPHGRILIGTGIRLEIPQGMYAEVVSRSGLTLNKGFEVLNSPGIIDADYRGEVSVILHNTTSNTEFITPGDRIAQIIFKKLDEIYLKNSDYIEPTDRGEGGFGSTGTK